jgi:ATP phosphoribosyltransferase regulatory subunit HisZ
VTDADVQLETYIRQQCLRHGTYSTEDVRARLAAHRNTGLADEVRRLREIAAQIVAYWDANYPGNVQQEKLDSLVHFLRVELDKAQAALAGGK